MKTVETIPSLPINEEAALRVAYHPAKWKLRQYYRVRPTRILLQIHHHLKNISSR